LCFWLIPGPGNLALITSTSKGGVRGGMGATLGVIAGDQVLMWVAVAGVAALLAAYPAAFAAVQWLGAAYLAWLGFKMLRCQARQCTRAADQPQPLFPAGLCHHLAEPQGHRLLHGVLSRCSSIRRVTRVC
jgi:leucine efflux protein